MASDLEWTGAKAPSRPATPAARTVKAELLTGAEAFALSFASAATAAAVVLGVTMLPLDTLRTSLDGEGLRADALASGTVGVALVIAGLFTLQSRREGSAPLRAGTSIAFGAVVAIAIALILTSSARTMSRSRVIDGVAVEQGLAAAAPWVAGIAFLLFGIWVASARRRHEAPRIAAATLLLSIGAATTLVAGWALAFATRLVVAAEARTHDVTRRTPLPWMAVVVALALASALWRRRSR